MIIGAVSIFFLTQPGYAAADGYPSPQQLEIAKTAAYVGSNECADCHGDMHAELAHSWHSKKTEWGPAHPEKFRKDKIYPWVVRDWDKLDTYMILDRKDKTTNYVDMTKVALAEVDLVVGGQRKQRYAKYYDGSPRKAWLATTEDEGISWKLDKSTVVDFPGNKERAGYKFLFIEVRPKDGDLNKNYYGEFYSWQERCISCHTTGFDHKAWDEAKKEFISGKREDLRDIFSVDISISCEACHGPGSKHIEDPVKENIILPTKIDDKDMRLMVCGQCHTRTAGSVHAKEANDLRGYRLGEKYEDYAEFVRPNWGKGNRATSIDGKGRRDHQQDMDMRLSATIHGGHSVHASMACFDCHDAHNVGSRGVRKPSARLKKPMLEVCGTCHLDQAKKVVAVLDGSKGWDKYSYGKWSNEGGRPANKQHIFNFDEQERSFGLSPDQYHWALKQNGDTQKEGDWKAIWPWEKQRYETKGMKVAVGATPWK
jgi:hypothetical protein